MLSLLIEIGIRAVWTAGVVVKDVTVWSYRWTTDSFPETEEEKFVKMELEMIEIRKELDLLRAKRRGTVVRNISDISGDSSNLKNISDISEDREI